MWSVRPDANMLSRICLVSETGMLEYMFLMSSEVNMDVGVMGFCFSSWISSVVFLTLNAYGKEENCLIFVVSSCESLYAGAFCQLTIYIYYVDFH